MGLRAATPADYPFLYALHSTTMRSVVEATWGWDEAWQEIDFERRMLEHEVSVIEFDGRSVGVLVLDAGSDAFHIVELQILPDCQGRGLGTKIVECVVARADERKLPVTLCVVTANRRAQRLYERLGFTVSSEDPPVIYMRRAGNDGQTR